MAGKNYNSIDEYLGAVESKLPEALLTYVAPKVEKILSDFTYKNVYKVANAAGRPIKNRWVGGSTYRRRYALPKSIVSRVEDNTLFVTSNAEPSDSILGNRTWGSLDGAFYDLLELKGSVLSSFPISGMFPRPVIGPAQKYVDMVTPSLQNSLIKGLKEML